MYSLFDIKQGKFSKPLQKPTTKLMKLETVISSTLIFVYDDFDIDATKIF